MNCVVIILIELFLRAGLWAEFQLAETFCGVGRESAWRMWKELMAMSRTARRSWAKAMAKMPVKRPTRMKVMPPVVKVARTEVSNPVRGVLRSALEAKVPTSMKRPRMISRAATMIPKIIMTLAAIRRAA